MASRSNPLNEGKLDANKRSFVFEPKEASFRRFRDESLAADHPDCSDKPVKFTRGEQDRGWMATSARSPGVAGGREPSVEIEGGADERQVRERLGEVAKVLRLGAQLLAVQPQVIGVAEHFLEEEPRLVQVPHAGEALDVPEGAHREGTFIPREAVGESAGETIAIDQRVAHQLGLDRAQR